MAKHGGIVVDFRGDSVMAMFGFPQPSEHDGRHATDAALELHDAIQDTPANCAGLPPLTLHSGVHCGPVLVIENDPLPGQFVVIGEATSLAARLSDAAVAGEILVSATTLSGDSHFYQTRDRGEFALQGKAESVKVLQVHGVSPTGTRFEARTQNGLTPFVGREPELRLLRQTFEEVKAGASREVAIVASGGVGKTRLVEEFLRDSARGAIQVCRGYCESYLAAEPLQPFLQMARQLARQEGVDVTNGPIDPAKVCDQFRATAARAPLVAFVDDWQWADDASKQLFATLRQMRVPCVLLLTASREVPSDAERGLGGRMLELVPLGDRDSEAILTKLSPRVDPLLAGQIVRLSGGNPLYIEELSHWTTHSGEARVASGLVDRSAWLSSLIEARVSRLTSRQREVIRVASVVGNVAPVWVLEQLAACGVDDPVLSELAERDLIHPGDIEGTVRFKHGVTRDVVYASIGLHDRRRLHRDIAILFERRTAPERPEAMLESLSYHFEGAGDVEQTARYAELAGDKALAAAATDRARDQYSAALDALETRIAIDDVYERWSRIVHRFGLACVFDPSHDQLTLFVKAAELARSRGDEAGHARAEYWLGFIHYGLGDTGIALSHYARAHESCTQALEQARQGTEAGAWVELEAFRVQLLAAIGQARAAAGEHAESLRLLNEALSVKRHHRRSGRPAVGSAYALACKGAVLGELGQFADAFPCFDEALEAIRSGHPAVEGSVLGWRSAVCLWQGGWAEARDVALRAQRLAEGISSLYVVAMAQCVIAYANWMLDGTSASVDVIARATSWLEARDKRLLISLNYGWLADIGAATGDVGRTRYYLARAIGRARRRDPLGVAMSYRAMATLMRSPDPQTADRYLGLALREADARQSPRERALTLLQQGRHAIDRAVARPLLSEARASFSAMGMKVYEETAARALARWEVVRSQP